MQQYVEYGFIRTQNMVEDGERRARRHANVGPVPAASQGTGPKVMRLRNARWASVWQQLRRSATRPARGEQQAG